MGPVVEVTAHTAMLAHERIEGESVTPCGNLIVRTIRKV